MVSAKGESDIVWGSKPANALPVSEDIAGTDSGADDYGPDDGGYDNFDDGDDDEVYQQGGGMELTEKPPGETHAVSVPSGLDITMEGGLLQAARTVEKVNIG